MQLHDFLIFRIR